MHYSQARILLGHSEEFSSRGSKTCQTFSQRHKHETKASQGAVLPWNFLIRFVKISQVTLVVAAGGRELTLDPSS